MPISPDRLKELSAIERYVFSHSKLSEVNFQDDDNIRAYTASFTLRSLLVGGQPKISGALPKEGAGLIVANHTGGTDIYLMHLLPILTADRTMRMVAKAILVNPDAGESEMMKNRRRSSLMRQAMDALGISAMKNRYIDAPYARSFRVIEAGGVNIVKSFREIRGELAVGNLVGVFPTGTRKPPLDFLDMLPLAGKIAVNAPDLPVIPVGISGRIVNIGESITYRQVLQEQNVQGQVYTKDGIAIMNRVIADRIGALIEDPHLYPAWWLERHGVFSEEQLRLMVAVGVKPYKLYLEAQKG